MERFRWSRWRLVQLAALAFASACGSGSTASTDVGTISLSLSPTADTVQAGAQLQVTGTLVRGDGFTGAVTVTVEGVPAGVTATADTSTIDGVSSALVHIMAAAAGATPGTYPLTVRAKASGLTDATASFSLTIASAAAFGYGLVAGTAQLPAVQGTSATSSIGITRIGGFGAPVALSATGLPSGATASFDPTPAPSLGSLLTITVGPTVTPGTYTVMISGTANGAADVTTHLTLVVSASPTFSITTGATFFALLPGTGGVTYVKATRGAGFTAPATFTVTGAPAGLTAVISTTSDPDSAVVTITTTGALAPGTYPLVVHANATGATERTATIQAVVGSAAGVDVRLDFSTCAQVIWVGYQDGTGPWTAVSGSGGVYAFHVNAAVGGIAVVRQNVQFFTTTVQMLTQAELHALTPASCNDNSSEGGQPGAYGTKLVNGTLNGVDAGDDAFVAMGSGSTGFPPIVGPATAFHILSVLDGAQDMFAYRYVDADSAQDRIVVRRDLDVADQGSLAPINFDSAEAVPPVFATFTIMGETGVGDAAADQLNILSGASCVVDPFSSGGAAYGTTTLFGIPTSLQRPSDYYALTVTDGGNYTGGLRSVTSTFHIFAPQTLTLGPVMPTSATISSLPGPYSRVQAAYALPPDYSTAGVNYHDASGHTFIVTASAGYRGLSAATIAAPDLSAASGYLTSWAPSTISQLRIFGTSNTSSSVCSEGTRIYGDQIVPAG